MSASASAFSPRAFSKIGEVVHPSERVDVRRAEHLLALGEALAKELLRRGIVAICLQGESLLLHRRIAQRRGGGDRCGVRFRFMSRSAGDHNDRHAYERDSRSASDATPRGEPGAEGLCAMVCQRVDVPRLARSAPGSREGSLFFPEQMRVRDLRMTRPIREDASS